MARIDHTGHNHPATPAGRAACRAGLTTPTTPVPAPVAPVITFKRVSEGLTNVLVDGERVGDIRKITTEVDRPIPGTTLRYAKGRMVTKYFVAIKGSSRDTFGCDRLTDAKTDAVNRISVLNRPMPY